MTDRVGFHLDHLMAHSSHEIYQPHVETWSERWARWFGGPRYVTDYVDPSGFRFALTKDEHSVFVPIEFSMIGSVGRYRRIMALNIARRNSEPKPEPRIDRTTTIFEMFPSFDNPDAIQCHKCWFTGFDQAHCENCGTERSDHDHRANKTPPVPKRQPATTNAQRMREAINAVAPDSFHVGWWSALAEREADDILDRLYRMIK